MFEKTSRRQTAVIFRLVSPIIPYVHHLNHNQCDRQHSSDELNSFMNWKFYSFSKNRNQKSDNSHEYTTDKSTIYLLRSTKNNLPNPGFCLFCFIRLFPTGETSVQMKNVFKQLDHSQLFDRLILKLENCIELLSAVSTKNKSVK